MNIKNYRLATENEWLFADDTVGNAVGSGFVGDMARGGNLLFQILTDEEIADGTPASVSLDGAVGITAALYQLIPAHVRKNSAPDGGYGVTDDYEAVKDFVTKKAPFDAYDGIAEPINGKFTGGRAAFAVRLTASTDAPVGIGDFSVTVTAGDLSVTVPVRLTVHKAVIPALADSALEVCNWIYPRTISLDHNVEIFSDKFYEVYRRYLAHLLDIRSNQLEINSGDAVRVIRDENGKVVDFDFSELEKLLRIGREMGFTTLHSPFLARWKVWNEPDMYFNWDPDVNVTSREGYRQMSIYFTRLYDMICRNGWKDCWWQCLVDEPQTANADAYRVMACICRRFMPDITIHDPLESTELGGGPDVWCVKQAVYEKFIDAFRELQAMGERMTYYTCAFPSGRLMNRVIDLPLHVGRLTFWMIHRYGFEGFLHWGYHMHASFEDAVGEAERYPAGNAYIVYPWGDTVCDSVRAFSQLAGAEDWELLSIIKRHDPEAAMALILRGCRTFEDYETDPAVIEEIRRDILAEADKYCE